MAANILLRMLLCCVLLLVSGVSRARDATAVESLLRADYSSVIIDGVRNQLRKHLDSGTLSPEKIVYVSCNPETLARDLACLTKRDYLVKKMQPVDMFPLTDSVEVVCLLENRRTRPGRA